MHVIIKVSALLSEKLYDRRAKFVSLKKKHLWEQLTPACMTEESDGEDGSFVTHKLTWRSEGNFVIIYQCN